MKRLFTSKYGYFLGALLLFASAFLYKSIHRSVSDEARSVSKFSTTLQGKEQSLKGLVSELAGEVSQKSYSDLFEKYTEKYEDLFADHGMALLVYQNDSLQFWTDNSVPVENYLQQVCLDKPIVKLNNGWFELIQERVGAKTVMGLLLIKKEYPYHNQYLEDAFQKDFDMPAGSAIVAGTDKDVNAIRNYKGEYLFTLQPDSIPPSRIAMALFVLLNAAALLLLLAGLREMFLGAALRQDPNYAFAFLCVSVLGLRFLSIYFHVPKTFYDLELFSPDYFANSFYNASLGDLLINSLLLLYLSYGFHKHFSLRSTLLFSDRLRKGTGGLLLTCLLLVTWQFTCYELISLVRDSRISFEVNNIFSLDIYSYVAFFVVGVLLFSFFFLADKLIREMVAFGYEWKAYLLFTLAGTAITALLVFLFYGAEAGHIFLCLPVLGVLYYWHRFSADKNVFVLVMTLVLIFSVSVNHMLSDEQNVKEEIASRALLEKLAEEKDPIAEVLYTDLEKKISADTMLTWYASLPVADQGAFLNRMRERYFNGYWEKYDINFFAYDSLCRIMVQSSALVADQHDYFEQVTSKLGQPTINSSLFCLPQDENTRSGFIGKISLPHRKGKTGKPTMLYVQIIDKFINDEPESGFPTLLLDKEVIKNVQVDNYSYARYRDGRLLNHVGEYEYDFNSASFGSLPGDHSVVLEEGYKHFVYRKGPKQIVVISRAEKNLLNKLTIFAYLFTFFSLMLLFYWLVRNLAKGSLFSSLNFKNKIQILFVAIVFVSVLLFGYATLFLLNQQYKKKISDNLDDRVHSVLVDLEQKLGDERSLNFSSDQYLTYLLTRMATVFSNDINLYDLRGNLLASSQNKLFEEGLISRKMNPVVYSQLMYENESEARSYEQIGKLNYLSAYIPFFNREHRLIAFINLPAFSKQSELEKEISTLLVTLINIYVFLFVLSVFLALFISSRITEPLKLLQSKLSKIKLGRSNELIEWKNKDEIGNLIIEYNRMIVELSNSAEMLAKSERESAWREMAKQVAHEIKNPLTPMKLSIQYLERSWKDKAPDWESKLEKVTKTLVEQIDTLTTIANEFSNFAKMPTGNHEQVALAEVVDTAVSLYRNEIRIETDMETVRHLQVYADKEQLLRVFNNIIKNAVQAIPEEREGLVKIAMRQEGNCVQVSVSDNGSGIAQDQQASIFMPNFTTKSSGTGLGLAMVKNIIEVSKGKIWFETEEGRGTTFFIELPLYQS